ncbi:glycosyltransferase [Oceanobacillus picturae]|uniref:glycosyltransferase n=1 Tax=Oceanobacillus picturae TaxID=171693 RepID=UPI0036380974
MNDNNYSVLMSVYVNESPDFFKTSIESMLEQSLKPEEIVIVKDGPLSEELNEILNDYKSKYSNLFTIVTLNHNVGLGKALNEGLKACRNELVARMDTDDISVKNRCEAQVREFMANKNLSIIGSHIDEFFETPDSIVSSRKVPLTHKEILKFSRRRNPFNHPTVMYKRSEVLNIGGYGDFRRNQDLELFVRMLNNGQIGKNIDKPLLLFRANRDNLKRRKSWVKCKSYIDMVYVFWKNGYSSLLDFLIVAISQIIVLIAPLSFLEWLSSRYLRKTKN